jgi:hypothetical protein
MQLGRTTSCISPELLEPQGSEYEQRVRAEGVRHWMPEVAGQRAAIASSFRPADGRRPPRRARYDLREFIY